MNSRIKFPRRVRIHGGECGAVARALHHEAKIKSLPAVKEKFFFTTIERKQMSTKTTLKRIALVAVSALGFGLLSSAPSANADWPTTISLGTPTANVAVVGQASTITVTTTVSATANNTDSFTVSAIPSAWPTGSGVIDDTDITAVAGSAVVAGTANYASAGTWASSLSGKSNEMTFTFSAKPSSSSYPASLTNTFTFTPDVAGSYTIAVFLDGSTTVSPTGAIKSGDTVKYVTVTAVTAPATTVAMTQQLAGTGVTYDATAAGAEGIWVRLNAKDSAGALTRVASSQLLMVTIPSGLTLRAKNNGGTTTTGLSATATDYALAASDFNSSGYAWLQFTASTAGTYNLSSKLSDGSASAVLSLVYAADTAYGAACAAYTDGNPDGSSIVAGFVIAPSGNQTSSTASSIASTQTSTDFTICSAAANVEDKVGVRVTDTNRKIFGNTAALSQDVLVTLGDEAGEDDYTDGKAYGSFTVAHSALGRITNDSLYSAFTVSVQSADLTSAPTNTNTITGALATGDSDNITITPATSLKVVNGGSITFTAEFENNYGAARTGLAVTAQISAGRNLQATATALVTDSNGKVTFTVTDAAPTSTTATSTVTFSDGTYSGTATITWVSSLTATTMTTSPSATSNDTSAKALSLGAVDSTGTASASRDSITATVKDEFGAVVIGMPVTLTKSADVSYYTGSSDVAYTNSLGVATWSVYTTKAGTYAFTFTGGGLTKTSYAKWTGGTARVVSVTTGTTSGDVTPVTISVTDAHGNKVPSSTVALSASGGYFQGVPLTSSQTTNAAGDLVVAFVGSGTVTASITGGQSLDLAGYVGTTAATGYPAGVASASVTITGGANAAAAAAEAATDAAAEAIDAANAATDAANLAAEAADAATVAAEEARDAADAATAAVEELATQVATLMAALKAQITTLANTVAKIAKKVKA